MQYHHDQPLKLWVRFFCPYMHAFFLLFILLKLLSLLFLSLYCHNYPTSFGNTIVIKWKEGVTELPLEEWLLKIAQKARFFFLFLYPKLFLTSYASPSALHATFNSSPALLPQVLSAIKVPLHNWSVWCFVAKHLQFKVKILRAYLKIFQTKALNDWTKWCKCTITTKRH